MVDTVNVKQTKPNKPPTILRPSIYYFVGTILSIIFMLWSVDNVVDTIYKFWYFYIGSVSLPFIAAIIYTIKEKDIYHILGFVFTFMIGMWAYFIYNIPGVCENSGLLAYLAPITGFFFYDLSLRRLIEKKGINDEEIIEEYWNFKKWKWLSFFVIFNPIIMMYYTSILVDIEGRWL